MGNNLKMIKVLLNDENLNGVSTQTIWQKLNEKYQTLNNELNVYLQRKREEFSFLSYIDLDKTKIDIVKLENYFQPTNLKYIDELNKNILTISKAINQLNHQASNYAEEKIIAASENAHLQVISNLEEVQYLEPLAKGFAFRLQEKLSSQEK